MNYMTAIIQLPLVKEAGAIKLKTPEDVSRLCSDMTNLAQETFQVLCLDSKNNLVERCMATLGISDASLVHPREVFRTAIEKNASAVLLVHNHPSGDPAPSAEDVRITKQLVEAGKIVDIKVLDHIIIGRRKKTEDLKHFISMREEGVCKF
ncbi:hypothetical protein BVX94_02275 [bacterium B17]|nr:hypothetical protein BVX94_02275 [bacterium B17]